MPEDIACSETIRQRALAELKILDTAPERDFDAVVSAARRIFGCRTAYISLIDTDRQWFKARQGFEPAEVPRECSICATAVVENREIVVSNLQAHPVYGAMPDIAAVPELQFFATIPLVGTTSNDGDVPIGTLCVIDDKPHDATREALNELRQLAHLIEALFRIRVESETARMALVQRKELVENLHRTQRQFELAEQMAQIGHWRMDLATQELFWSPETCAIHGIEKPTKENLQGGLDYFPGRDRSRIADAVEECVTNGTPYDLELDFCDARGVYKRVRAIGEQEIVDGEAVAIIGVIQDITQRYRLETRLRVAAHSDELTRLPNRAHLNQYLDSLIDAFPRSGRPMALLLIDLDHFKQVNDELGHETGDHVLKTVAEQMRSAPFAGQLSARLGGDEFVMVIEDRQLLADLDGTLDLLLERLSFDVSREDETRHVSATIGATWLSDGNNERSALLRCADHALYQAKRAERGTAAICPDAIAGDRLRSAPQLRAVV